MAISARTAQALHQTLGDDAADDVVNWMHRMDAGRSELRELNKLNHARLDARLDALEARMDAREARMEARMDVKFAHFRDDIRSDMTELRLELRGAIAASDAKMERRFADLLTWSFVFWVGAVGAIAALARVLR